MIDLKRGLKDEMDRRLYWVLTTVNLSLKAAALHPAYGRLHFISPELKQKVWASLEKECELFYQPVVPDERPLMISICTATLQLYRKTIEKEMIDPEVGFRNRASMYLEARSC